MRELPQQHLQISRECIENTNSLSLFAVDDRPTGAHHLLDRPYVRVGIH